MTVLAKLLGLVLLVIGGIIAFGVLMVLFGAIFGILVFALKLAAAVVLVYLGYRFIARDRPAY